MNRGPVLPPLRPAPKGWLVVSLVLGFVSGILTIIGAALVLDRLGRVVVLVVVLVALALMVAGFVREAMDGAPVGSRRVHAAHRAGRGRS